MSAFIVCLITVDRLMVVRFPFSRRRFTASHAHLASLLAWTVGLVVAGNDGDHDDNNEIDNEDDSNNDLNSFTAPHAHLASLLAWTAGLVVAGNDGDHDDNNEIDNNDDSNNNFEGSRPEWCISTIHRALDTPFWSGTLDLYSFTTSYSYLFPFSHRNSLNGTIVEVMLQHGCTCGHQAVTCLALLLNTLLWNRTGVRL